MHEASVERKNSFLSGRNLWQNQIQGGWPSASTSSGYRGQERGNNKHHHTKPGIPAEKEKHTLMITIMSNVHGV